MTSRPTAVTIVAALCLCWTVLDAHGRQVPADSLDVKQVLDRHAAALGGADKLTGFHSLHVSGTLEVSGFPGQGTIESWFESPCRMREEVHLGPMRITAGVDNGDGWTRDANGRVTPRKSPAAIREALLDCLIARYAYLEPGVFDLRIEGPKPVELLDGRECVILHLTDEPRDLYLDPQTWLPAGLVGVEEGLQSVTLFDDYRDVQGIQVSFRQEVRLPQVGQTLRVNLLDASFDEPLADSLFTIPRGQIHDFGFETGRGSVVVPAEVRDGLVFLKASVGGDDPRRFLLDSGAGKTVLDSSYAATLGLAMEAVLPGVGAGEVSAIRLVTLPPILLPGLRLEEQSGAAMPLREWTDWLGGIEIRGVLGFDFLSRFVTRIDYGREEITFWDPDSFALRPDAQRIPPDTSSAGLPVDPRRPVFVTAPLVMNVFTLPVRVNGGAPTTFILDTGAQATVLGRDLAQRRGLSEAEGARTEARGAGGSEYFRLVRLKSLEVAGITVDEPLAAVRLRQGGALQVLLDAVVGEDGGILGGNVLREFVITLDYGNQRVVFEKRSDEAD